MTEQVGQNLGSQGGDVMSGSNGDCVTPHKAMSWIEAHYSEPEKERLRHECKVIVDQLPLDSRVNPQQILGKARMTLNQIDLESAKALSSEELTRD